MSRTTTTTTSPRPLRTVAIVNRGEAAVRLLHAVRELNAARGEDPSTPPVRTVALHVTEEAGARFVREADAGYDLGPAAARPYLDLAVLERALTATGADAAWVGWGFVAEDPAFAELCDRLGVTFVGPNAQAMRRLGDKIGAKLLAESVGVPVAPWSRGPVSDLEQARAAADRIGYPLVLKATAGGGGRGIRVVTTDAELADAFERTRQEAARAFGSDVVFLERLVTGARHVEVQVVADGQGTAWALGVRDCSVQRRNQKLIEESSSPVLPADADCRLRESAERLVLEVGYRGAATVEFLYHPGDGTLAFLEVNTRLQVEHPVTELTTGTDLVKTQLHVAAGGRLEGERPREAGHAVEARLNAEDPDRDFAPAPGRVALLRLPSGPGVRVDTGLAEGDTIPAEFDSMVAKVIATGRDRGEALARLRRALADTHVVVEGGTTNKGFLLDLLHQREVVDGSADTGWIDRVRASGRLASTTHAGVAVVVAAIEVHDQEEAHERAHFLTTAHGGRPHVRHEPLRAVELRLRDRLHRVTVTRRGPTRYRVAPGEGTAPVDVGVERFDRYTARVTIGDSAFQVVSATHGAVHTIDVEGAVHRVWRDEGGVVRSPAPALVVATPVGPGDRVRRGERVVVLESMKMETVLTAPHDGVVREVAVAVGGQVESGTPLLRLDPDDPDAPDAAQDPATPRPAADVPEPLGLPEAASSTGEDPAATAVAALRDLRDLVLGHDLLPGEQDRALAAYRAVRAGTDPVPPAVLDAEVALLEAFADVAEVARNRPAGEEDAETRVHSPREHLHSYLHSLDAERERLPESFRRRLVRALAHYGVGDLERTPALEQAVYRLFLAQQQAAAHAGAVAAVLQQWLTDRAPDGVRAEHVHDVLDHLVLATQLRHPLLGDLARSARFRWFDQPLVDAARADVLAGVPAEVDALADPEAPDRAGRIDALVAVPERIVGVLAQRLERGVPAREPMLEVLVGRHYREHDVRDLRVHDGSRAAVSARYTLDGRDTVLVSTLGHVEELAPDAGPGAPGRPTRPAPLARDLADLLAGAGSGAGSGVERAVDLYLYWPGAPVAPDDLADRLRAVLEQVEVLRRVERVVVGVHPGDGRDVQYLTYQPERYGAEDDDPTRTLVEDRLVRGVHPMVARRLDLWRLRDFEVTRLEAPGDVLLYHCVAPDNPSDQRLVALAQVRELVVVRDAEGTVTSLPHLERALAACLEAIRGARSARGPAGSRLDTNHVWLTIWPVLDASLEELLPLKERVSPLTVGAGVQEVVVQGRVRDADGGTRRAAVRFGYRPGTGVVADVGGPPTRRLAPLDGYAQKVIRARRRGAVHPHELAERVAGPGGQFTEYDLAEDGATLVPVDRPKGRNSAGVVVGVAVTPTARHPEGVRRVVLMGDPTRALGAVAEPECRRIIAALDLAERLDVPVDWYALSAGARIAMDSGTENMDWVARALRRLVRFTQDGRTVHVVVAGITVGAQPYWNAEATMLMHTKGILVMTPDSAMVLTGKQSLDFSGGVSAEDNVGIGGYDRVMGPNGQAQYWAPDLGSAVDLLLAHHEHTYRAPGEPGPRRARTTDPVDRDVCTTPHTLAGSDFATIGDVFSAERNPERKKPFDIRTLMRAVADADQPVLERWADMADAETSVVLDASLGGWPVCLVGIESHPVPRRGFPPSDGPATWTAGTLFPRSSKKTARAINAASGNRPVVVLANLSGFDGSPESMRNLQLEYGAEIGRAVVNFDGPIVFCVVSRYHGGAFVVFSKALNDAMTVLAVEGSYASVIGGAPAAAVVFAGEVDARTAADPRVRALEERLAAADDAARAGLLAELDAVRSAVRTERLAEVAAEFDRVHSIHRAVQVGSVDEVIAPHELRPRLVAAVEAGLARCGRGAPPDGAGQGGSTTARAGRAG